MKKEIKKEINEEREEQGKDEGEQANGLENAFPNGKSIETFERFPISVRNEEEGTRLSIKISFFLEF